MEYSVKKNKCILTLKIYSLIFSRNNTEEKREVHFGMKAFNIPPTFHLIHVASIWQFTFQNCGISLHWR